MRPGPSPGGEDPPGGGHGNPLQYLPGEPHGQRSLAGYSPWDCKESDMTEQLSTAQHPTFSSNEQFHSSPMSSGSHPKSSFPSEQSVSNIDFTSMLVTFTKHTFIISLRSKFTHPKPVVPDLFGSRDWFHRRQLFHAPGWKEGVDLG